MGAVRRKAKVRVRGRTLRNWRTVILLVAVAGTGGIVASRSAAPQGAKGDTWSVALASLEKLPIRERASKSGYGREQFGQRWADTDHNGCDTRNDILNRDLEERAWRPGTGGCVVVAGLLQDPYTGMPIRFEKSKAFEVQIDHVVALSNAWQTGAQALDPPRRMEFANDPLNLLAVDGPTNEAKGDADAAEWMVPNPNFRCSYVVRQIEVKVRYGLWTTPEEHDAMRRVLATCSSRLQ